MDFINSIKNTINTQNAEAIRENKQKELAGEDIGLFESIGNIFEEGVYNLRDMLGEVGGFEKMTLKKMDLDAKLEQMQEEMIAKNDALNEALQNYHFSGDDASDILSEYKSLQNEISERYNSDESK